MADSEQVKAALAALAAGETRESTLAAETGNSCVGPTTTAPSGQPADYRAVIERAVAATDDLDAAADFVDSVGLDRLDSAVRSAEREVSGLADDGREALATYERFRIAAEGPVE
jgi:hypothetical protein